MALSLSDACHGYLWGSLGLPPTAYVQHLFYTLDHLRNSGNTDEITCLTTRMLQLMTDAQAGRRT